VIDIKLAALEWLELQSRRKLSDTPIISDQVITPSIEESVQSIIPVRTTKQVDRTTGTERALAALDTLPEIPVPLRKLTPAGRLYETTKALAALLIITDPLNIID